MPAPCIQLWEHVGLGLIISWPSGILFTNQTGGTSCLRPEFEGVFVPLCNDCTLPELVLLSPANELWDYFTGPRWQGTGATNGLQAEDADFIDAVLLKARLFPAIRVDRSRLRESHEAWVYVTISGEGSSAHPVFSGFAPYPRAGILTWSNSD
jgi:hypothetical protein